MQRYPEGAWERARKVQEVILRAVARKITWWQAAEILGISMRSMRRWRGTLAGCRVTICEHLDGQVSIVHGPHVVGRYTAEGNPWDGVPEQRRKPGGEGRRPVGAPTPVALRAPSVSAPTARA